MLLLSLAAVPAVAVGTFFNLYYIHSYYECAILPALVVVEAAAVEVALQRLPARLPMQSPAIVAVALAAIWGTSWTSDLGRGVISSMETSPQPNPLGMQMRDVSAPGSKFVMVGCGWDPEFLYYADRRGLMYQPGSGPALDAVAVAREYQYVASCSGKTSLNQLPPRLLLRAVNGYIWQITGVAS